MNITTCNTEEVKLKYRLGTVSNRLLGVCTLSGFTGWMDGCMTCDFTFFSTVLQSYQDDERLIMKGCVQWNPVYG